MYHNRCVYSDMNTANNYSLYIIGMLWTWHFTLFNVSDYSLTNEYHATCKPLIIALSENAMSIAYWMLLTLIKCMVLIQWISSPPKARNNCHLEMPSGLCVEVTTPWFGWIYIYCLNYKEYGMNEFLSWSSNYFLAAKSISNSDCWLTWNFTGHGCLMHAG